MNPETLTPILSLLLVVVVFYFMLIRPQQKRDKAHKQMLSELAVGDDIVTIGGICGKVVSIKDETLVLETSHDRTHIRILKSAVQRVDVKAEDAQD